MILLIFRWSFPNFHDLHMFLRFDFCFCFRSLHHLPPFRTGRQGPNFPLLHRPPCFVLPSFLSLVGSFSCLRPSTFTCTDFVITSSLHIFVSLSAFFARSTDSDVGFHLCFNFVSYSLSDLFMGTLYLSLIFTHRPTSPPPKYLNLPLYMASLSLVEHTSRQWRTRPLSFRTRGESSWPDRLW
jgi:hypothetical protein